MYSETFYNIIQYVFLQFAFLVQYYKCEFFKNVMQVAAVYFLIIPQYFILGVYHNLLTYVYSSLVGDLGCVSLYIYINIHRYTYILFSIINTVGHGVM